MLDGKPEDLARMAAKEHIKRLQIVYEKQVDVARRFNMAAPAMPPMLARYMQEKKKQQLKKSQVERAPPRLLCARVSRPAAQKSKVSGKSNGGAATKQTATTSASAAAPAAAPAASSVRGDIFWWTACCVWVCWMRAAFLLEAPGPMDRDGDRRAGRRSASPQVWRCFGCRAIHIEALVGHVE
jgi:hypothetical protein